MTNSLRIAQVLAGAPIGGAENFYTRLVSALNYYPQLDQRAFTRPNTNRESLLKQAGVDVELFRFGGPLHFINNARYQKTLQQWQADIVVTYMNRASQLTPPGNYQLVARLGHYYDLKYYRHCDHWIGISKGICNHLINGGMPSKKVAHIPNFVDESSAEAIPRTSFNTPAGAPIIFALGRLHTNKAFDILLRALSDMPDATLWLAGDGPERQSLEALCRDLGLVERVKFLGWRTDVNALMRTADVFVCPSRHEGLGSIIPEAWFNQCPMVATNSQGPGELISHEDTGLVTPVDEVEPLVSAIKQLLASPEQAKAMANRGYDHYQNNYSKEIICAQYLDFFSRIAQR